MPGVELDLRKFTAEELLEKEWLITNGLGGYASGTLLGELTRRYHGHFVSNLASPMGRHLMISRLCETIFVGNEIAHIGERIRPGQSSTVEALSWLQSFRQHGNTVHWTFSVGDAVIEKSVLMPHSQNTVCIRYTLLSGRAAKLRLRPFLAFRRHDAPLNRLGYARFATTLREGRFELALDSSPLILRVALQPSSATFVSQPADLEHELSRERRRGHEYAESAHSVGYFEGELIPGLPLTLVATTHNADRLDFDVNAAFEAESHRVAALTGDVFGDDAFAVALANAADQFLVLPASRLEDAILAQGRGHELRSVIAGYHWFGDWGRDTMISLEGLMLCTGRHREARATLQTFATYVADGLLPNLFPEGEREGLYHTVDATLWYFQALYRYLEVTDDTALLTELLPVLESIVHHHVIGTKFGIHMDESDCLIAAAAEGYQLTWMDAKVDGWVVTPRRGKPVEIQALWYNALRLLSTWTESTSLRDTYIRIAERARRSFNERYWNPVRDCLLDVIDGPNDSDPSIRPNQIFSISLAHPILDAERWRPVLDSVREHLLTPYGLRTLSRDHPDYKATYFGDLRSRDAAYHQGTVWPWLFGHFIDAWLKIEEDKSRARKFLSAFEEHIADAGVGSISEIFDAEPPHAPHGCIAQAWSVAEVLRARLATRS